MVTTTGEGWFGTPSVAGSALDGRDGHLAFTTRAVAIDRERMTVRLEDARTGLGLDVAYTITAAAVLEQVLTLRNLGTAPFRVDRLMACFPLPEPCDEVVACAGRWAMEFQERIEPLGVAAWSRINRRGRTSHDGFPGVILRSSARFDQRIACGFQLAWSGNHEILIEPLDDGGRIVQIGEHWAPGEVVLAPGESVTTPVAIMTAPGSDRDEVRRSFHRYARALARRRTARKPRPVTLNTWEANYFALDEARLRAQAEAAAALGIERFVLDDGWFGRRDDDTRSLGDWTPHAAKFPNGLRPLAEFVNGLGMEFGLWVEPEMVNPDSDLFRAHPDWILRVPGRPDLTARHQLVLDLTRVEVVEHLFGRLDAILRSAPIAYLKWDMNRDLTAAYGQDGRPATRRQVLALYDLIDRLRDAHPGVEIESCASGGGRADLGILARTDRVWTSDGTDALTRIAIQNGFLQFLPPEIMGAHVSASPNHQTGRRHSLAFRAIVALIGHFGVELDPLALAAEERLELAGWIALHKRLRPLFHDPRSALDRIPDQDGRSGWIGRLDREAVLVLVQERQQSGRIPPPLRVPCAGACRLSVVGPGRPAWPRATPAQRALLEGTLIVAGGDLARVGLQLPELPPQSGLVIHIEPVD
jgi:alpha-galactosidase